MTKQPETSMRDRFRRFLALLGVVALIALAVFMYDAISRLSKDALALGAGVLIGLAILLVFIAAGILVFYLAIRWRETEKPKSATRATGTPPVVVVTGGGQPWAMQQPGAYPQQALPTTQTERGYEVIGTD